MKYSVQEQFDAVKLYQADERYVSYKCLDCCHELAPVEDEYLRRVIMKCPICDFMQTIPHKVFCSYEEKRAYDELMQMSDTVFMDIVAKHGNDIRKVIAHIKNKAESVRIEL